MYASIGLQWGHLLILLGRVFIELFYRHCCLRYEQNNYFFKVVYVHVSFPMNAITKRHLKVPELRVPKSIYLLHIMELSSF